MPSRNAIVKLSTPYTDREPPKITPRNGHSEVTHQNRRTSKAEVSTIGYLLATAGLVVVRLSADVGATAYFPPSFAGSPGVPTAIDSPTWAPVVTQQYVTADMLAAAAAGPSVIVASDSASSHHHHHQHQVQQQQQQVPAQPMHVLQPYPQHVSVVPAAQAAVPQQSQHPVSYLQQPTPAPAPLQVCNTVRLLI